MIRGKLFAMIEQLGLPTFYITFSYNEISGKDVKEMLMDYLIKYVYKFETEDEINNFKKS